LAEKKKHPSYVFLKSYLNSKITVKFVYIIINIKKFEEILTMYINFINDRKKLGYQVLDDTACGNHLVMRIDSIVTNLSPMEVESSYVYSFKLKNKVKKTIAIIVLGTTFWMGTAQPSEAMGLSIPPRSTPVGRVQPSYQNPAELKIAKLIPRKADRISYKSNKEILLLVYLNDPRLSSYKKVLKIVNKLRAGDLSGNLGLIAIGVVVFIMCQLPSVDAFTIFDQIGKWNAPTTNPGFAPGCPRPGST